MSTIAQITIAAAFVFAALLCVMYMDIFGVRIPTLVTWRVKRALGISTRVAFKVRYQHGDTRTEVFCDKKDEGVFIEEQRNGERFPGFSRVTWPLACELVRAVKGKSKLIKAPHQAPYNGELTILEFDLTEATSDDLRSYRLVIPHCGY